MSKTLSLSNKINIPDNFLRYTLYEKTTKRDSYYNKIEIPKASGGTRVLHAVMGRMRTLQNRANKYLTINYKPSPFAKGFVQGGGIIENARVHTNKKIIFKYDIKDFFPNITFARVRGMFMAKPFLFTKTEATIFAQICCLDNNGPIPQGGITSPFISNMICRRLDRSLFDLSQKQFGMDYTRYADDLTLSTNKYVNIEEVNKAVEEIVNDEGFKLNKGKTRVSKKGQRQVVTGIIVNDGLNVNRKYIRNLKSIIHNCIKFGLYNNMSRDGRDFKDKRNTCSPLYMDINGDIYRYKSSEKITYGFAKYIFLKHIHGRLNFIKQVAEANSDETRRIKRLSIHKKIERQYDLLMELNGIQTAQSKARRQDDEVISRNSTVDEITHWNKEQLDQFTYEQAKTDVRFFLENFEITDLEKYRKRVAKLYSFKPITLESNYYVLKDIQGSESATLLSRIVHDHTIQKEAIEKWKINYGAYSEELNRNLKRRINEFIERRVMTYLYSNGLDEANLWQDEDFRNKWIKPFKRETRYGKQSSSSTQLVEQVKKLCNNSNMNYNLEELTNITIYTDVPSVERAFACIMKSMHEHTQSKKLTISRVSTDEFWELIINDQNMEQIDIDPNRNFLNGDLLTAVSNLAGLCEYVIRFNSNSSGWLEIDTMTDRVETINPQSGFTHVLRFKK